MANNTRLLVLGAVKIFQPVHGYDVRRELLSWRVEEWASVQPGSIYHHLRALTKDGMLEVVDVERPNARPARTTYRITERGEQEFLTMLRVNLWTVGRSMEDVLVGLSFLPYFTREEAIAALQSRIDQIENFHKGMAFWDPVQFKPAYVGEVFRLSESRLQAEATWAAGLIERLRNGEYEMADNNRVDSDSQI